MFARTRLPVSRLRMPGGGRLPVRMVAGSVQTDGGGVDDAPTTNQKYVRQGASGTASGNDWTNAYTTLPATLERDTTYWIADGTYGGYTFDDAASGPLVIRVKKATASLHGIETGWSAGYGDGVATFTGQFVFTTANWIIDGSFGGGPDSWSAGHGIKITDTTEGPGYNYAVVSIGYSGNPGNIKLRHLELVGPGSETVTDAIAWVDNATGTLLVSHCWMHDTGRCHLFQRSCAADFTFEYNHFDTLFAGSTIHGEVMSTGQGGVGNGTLRHNLFTDVQSTGGLMWDNESDRTKQLKVHGNVFYRPSGRTWAGPNGCIGGWTGTGSPPEDCYNMRIYNNTFIDVNIRCFTDFMNRSGDNEVINNLFYNCQSPSYADIQTNNYNHYIASGGDHGELNGTSATSGDPFVNYVNMNFRLTGNTTAGSNLGATYNADMYGNTRTTWTRGAVEYV
jgi:hypothetical protein